MFWYAAVQMKNEKRAQELMRTKPITKDMVEDYILEEFEDYHYPIKNIIKQTPLANLICAPIYDLPELPKWHTGNTVLLGDACHATQPNLAQGACLAIEDAIELAHCLRSVPTFDNQTNSNNAALEKALAEYEQKRRFRAKTVQTISNLIALVGQVEHKNLQKIRDAIMQAVPEMIKAPIFDAVLKFSLGWNYKPPKL